MDQKKEKKQNLWASNVHEDVNKKISRSTASFQTEATQT